MCVFLLIVVFCFRALDCVCVRKMWISTAESCCTCYFVQVEYASVLNRVGSTITTVNMCI